MEYGVLCLIRWPTTTSSNLYSGRLLPLFVVARPNVLVIIDLIIIGRLLYAGEPLCFYY